MCKKIEILGSIFDMKLIQNSEIHVFKSGILQKSSTVEILPSMAVRWMVFYGCKKVETFVPVST